MKYEELRKQYTEFYYHSFDIEDLQDAYRFTFHFEAKGLSEFAPTMTIPKPKDIPSHLNTKYVKVWWNSFPTGKSPVLKMLLWNVENWMTIRLPGGRSCISMVLVNSSTLTIFL